MWWNFVSDIDNFLKSFWKTLLNHLIWTNTLTKMCVNKAEIRRTFRLGIGYSCELMMPENNICTQEGFTWQKIWQSSIYLFKVPWNGHLVSYFSLMDCCEIKTDLLVLTFSCAELLFFFLMQNINHYRNTALKYQVGIQQYWP